MKDTGRTVLSITVITLLCRILTLISIQSYISFYGGGDIRLNIFMYALNIPNVIFTSVGAALIIVVVPLYASILSKDQKKADDFLHKIISVAGLLLVALAAAGFLLAPVIPMLGAYRYEPENYKYAVFSLRVLMPVIFFFGLSNIFQGMLQTNGRFLAPAAVSLPTSLITICYIFFFGDRYGVTGLLFTTLAGLSLQVCVLIIPVIKTGYRYRPRFGFRDPEIVSAARMAVPVLIGVSAYQFNMIFNATMSTYFKAEALLIYAQNLILVSVLSFIYSMTAVYFPRLARLWTSDDAPGYKFCLTEIINTALFFLIPLTVGFIALRYQVFDLLARWRNFGERDMLLSGDFMGLYAIGIIAMGLKEILDRGFYAQKNTRISAVAGFFIMGVNIVLSLILMNFIGVYALPLSYSISSCAGVAVLYIKMRKICGPFTGIARDIFKCAAAAVIMGAVIIAQLYFLKRMDAYRYGEVITRAVRLFAPVLSGVIIYFAASYLMGVMYCKKLFVRFLYKKG